MIQRMAAVASEKIDLISQQKIAPVATSGGTILTGVATVLEKLPVVLGCVASIAGIVLSIVLTVTCIKKWRLEKRILENKIRQQEKQDED